MSHDLGDFVALVDGRRELVDECARSEPELRAYLAERAAALLGTPAFLEALPGHLPGDAASQQRLPDLIATLKRVAGLANPAE